jgi:hypothetical protein
MSPITPRKHFLRAALERLQRRIAEHVALLRTQPAAARQAIGCEIMREAAARYWTTPGSDAERWLYVVGQLRQMDTYTGPDMQFLCACVAEYCDAVQRGDIITPTAEQIGG